MITIDCHELTVDEQLALAAAISDGLMGRALALVKDTQIVLDPLLNQDPDSSEVATVIRGFLSKRKEAEHYSFETDGERFVVHSADPLARARGRKTMSLPANVLKCPWCGFVTQYQEMYTVHVRAHAVGL